MADNVYDTYTEPQEPHLPPPPPKNFVLFSMNENEGFFPKGILEGEMGPLPLFMAVNVGYDPENEDPFMYPYESQEILFAYKKGAQKRVLLRDINQRTYSLPEMSKMEFCVGPNASEELTVAEIVRRYQLPLFGVEFARPDRLDFVLDKQNVVDSTHFGSLTLTRVYEEPFLYCLSISGGTPNKIPRVLPRNLKEVCFAPIIKVKGVQDSASKIQEFKDKYTKFAQELDYHDDPFFQELALVSEGPQPMDGPIEPYIDDTTFISVQYHHRRIPDLPYAPVVPSRNPITLTFQDADQDWDNKKYRSQEWESVADFEKHYTQLRPDSTDEHVYSLPQDLQADLVAETCIRDLKIRAQSRAVVKPTVKGGTAHAYSQPPPLPPDFQRSVGHARVTPPNGCDVRQGEKPHRPPPFVPMVQTSGVGLMSPPPARPALSPAPPLPPRRQPDDELPSLTVRDVGKKLKALGLGKYAKKFSDQLIDGKYLKKLVEQPDTLVKEFKMTQVEILKLFTYVNEGHIPKQETQK